MITLAIYLIKQILEIIIPLFYLACASTIFSLGAFMGMVFKFYKDLADAGLKINYQKLTDSNSESAQPAQRNRKELKNVLLTPGLNVFFVFRLTYCYQDYKAKIYQEFDDVIEKMTKWEQAQYLKHPSGFRAFKLMRDWYCNYPVIRINLKEDTGISEAAFYLRDDETLDIIATKGPLAQKSLNEQEDLIIGLLTTLYLEALKRYKTQEEVTIFISSLSDENNTYYFDLRENYREENEAEEIIDLDEVEYEKIPEMLEYPRTPKLKLTRKKKEKFTK